MQISENQGLKKVFSGAILITVDFLHCGKGRFEYWLM
jgi:hypothetical protein